MTEGYQEVAARAEVKVNELKLVQVGETQVILTELNGEVIAFRQYVHPRGVRSRLRRGRRGRRDRVRLPRHAVQRAHRRGYRSARGDSLPIYQVQVEGDAVSVGPRKN